MLLVANRLELEGAVGHVEMPAEAFAKPVQHLARATLADACVVHDDINSWSCPLPITPTSLTPITPSCQTLSVL
jgi:hypothetical protein